MCVYVCCVCAHVCAHVFISTRVAVLDRIFIFPSCPNVDALCGHHPPPTLYWWRCTHTQQSYHSRVASLQGCAAPVCHFPGCHSLGKHLLSSVTVMRHERASQPCSSPSIKLRCLNTVQAACRTEMLASQEGDC